MGSFHSVVSNWCGLRQHGLGDARIRLRPDDDHPVYGNARGVTDSSAPSYTVTAGGTTGVTANVIKFRATNEGVILQKLGLSMTNASTTASGAMPAAFASSTPADITQAYVYAGNNILTTSGTAVAAGTLLGTATFTGNNTFATSTLSTAIQLPNNLDATLVIKTDLANIGTSQPGTDGALIQLDYLNAQGTGIQSGQTVYGSALASGTGVSGIRTFRSYPTIALDSSMTNSILNGDLMRFKVTANSSGSVVSTSSSSPSQPHRYW